MATAQTSTRAPTTQRSFTMTSDADRLRELMVGPEGLPPEQFDALVAGWDPAEAPLVQFLVARGFLDRIGAQTLSTVLKGYVQLRGIGLCNLFKGLPGPAAPTSRPTPARSGAREAGSRDRDASPRDASREAPGRDSPHSTPSVSATLAFAPRPGPRVPLSLRLRTASANLKKAANPAWAADRTRRPRPCPCWLTCAASLTRSTLRSIRPGRPRKPRSMPQPVGASLCPARSLRSRRSTAMVPNR